MSTSIQPYPDQGKNTQIQGAHAWAITPDYWHDLPISPQAFRLLSLLNQLQGGKLENQVGLRYLSQRLRTSRQALTRAANELLEVGVITRRGTWRSSVYQVANPVRRSYGTNKGEQWYKNVPKQWNENVPTIYKQEIYKENKQTSQTEQATLEVAASVAAVVSGRSSFKDCNDQERSYIKAFAVSLENQVGGSIQPSSLKAETLTALLIASDQGYTAQEAAAVCSQYFQQEQQRRALNGQEPIRSATRWLIAILPSVLSGAEAEPINQQIPDYPPNIETWKADPNPEIWEAEPDPEVWTSVYKPIRFATEQERQEIEAIKESRKNIHIKDLLKEKGYL